MGIPLQIWFIILVALALQVRPRPEVDGAEAGTWPLGDATKRLRHEESPDGQDRREALLDVAHRPTCLLQVSRELAVARVAVLPEQLGVGAVQLQLGHERGVQPHRPLTVDPAHDDIGRHVQRGGLAEAPARVRVEAADRRAGGPDVRR